MSGILTREISEQQYRTSIQTRFSACDHHAHLNLDCPANICTFYVFSHGHTDNTDVLMLPPTVSPCVRGLIQVCNFSAHTNSTRVCQFPRAAGLARGHICILIGLGCVHARDWRCVQLNKRGGEQQKLCCELCHKCVSVGV